MKKETSRKILKKGELRQPSKKVEEAEFDGGKKGVLICPKCKAVYKNKSWHHKEKYSNKEIKEMGGAKPYKCPVCTIKENNLCEGFIILKNIPTNKEKDVLALVKNIAERAEKTDVLDRIIKLKKNKEGIKIETTENQLAVKLGKQIKRAFKGKLDIHWAETEGPARVFWTAP
jgi:NMD protein affecting ribosome stability and mRNA decay